MNTLLRQVNDSLPGRLVRTVLLGSVELAAFFPVLLSLHLLLSPFPLWVTFLQLVACYGLGCIGGETGWLTRKIGALLFAALSGAAVFVPLNGPAAPGSWVLGAAGAWLVFRGIRLGRTPWDWYFPPTAFLFGLSAYFIAVPLIARIDSVKMYAPLANTLGFAVLVIFVFYLNRLRLLGATLSFADDAEKAVTGAIRRNNRLWLSGAVALIAVIGFLPQLKAVVMTALSGAAGWLHRHLFTDRPQLEATPAPEATPGPLPQLGGEPQEPSWLTEAINLVLLAASYAVTAALALFLLYFLIMRVMPALWTKLRRLFGRFGTSDELGPTGYVDEKETLLAWRELPAAWLKNLQARLTPKPAAPDWKQLTTPSARIRYLYTLYVGHAVRKGYRFNPALTPQETQRELDAAGLLPPEAGELLTSTYEGVRYGGREPDEAELGKVLEQTRPILPNHVK